MLGSGGAETEGTVNVDGELGSSDDARDVLQCPAAELVGRVHKQHLTKGSLKGVVGDLARRNLDDRLLVAEQHASNTEERALGRVLDEGFVHVGAELVVDALVQKLWVLKVSSDVVVDCGVLALGDTGDDEVAVLVHDQVLEVHQCSGREGLLLARGGGIKDAGQGDASRLVLRQPLNVLDGQAGDLVARLTAKHRHELGDDVSAFLLAELEQQTRTILEDGEHRGQGAVREALHGREDASVGGFRAHTANSCPSEIVLIIVMNTEAVVVVVRDGVGVGNTSRGQGRAGDQGVVLWAVGVPVVGGTVWDVQLHIKGREW